MLSFLSTLQGSVDNNVIDLMEGYIQSGAFTQLITRQVSEGDDSRSYAEVIGRTLATKGNKDNQLRRLFDDLKMIQQRVEALQMSDIVPEIPNLADLKGELRTLTDEAEDARNLLDQLKEIVEKYETSGPVESEIRLSLGLERSRLAYLAGKMEPPAPQFFEKSMDAVLANPTYVRFQDFLKCVECVYAYFKADARSE